MTNASVLSLPQSIRQNEFEEFLSGIQSDIEALSEQIGEPEAGDGTDLEAKVSQAVSTKVRVRSQPTFEATWNELRTLMALKNRITATFKTVKQAADHLHSKVSTWEQHYLNRVLSAQAERKQAVGDYYVEMEEKWLARQAELEAIAAGQVKDGEAQEAVVAPATLEKQPGGSISKGYEAKLNNLMDLIKAVAAGEAPMELLKFDQAAGNKLASAQKDSFHLPGVSAVWKPQVRVNAWK